MKLILLTLFLVALATAENFRRGVIKVRHGYKRQAGGCLYEGQTYQQGQSWTVPCKYNCQCTDGSTGHYECRDVCPSYGTLPQGCQLVKEDPNSCCSSPKCSFQTSGTQGSGHGTMQMGGGGGSSGGGGGDGGFHLFFGTTSPSMQGGGSSGACQDKLQNCKDYGDAVCSDPTYTAWVTENCANFCGKCGGMVSGGGMTSGGGTSGGGMISGGGTSGGGMISGGGTLGGGIISGGGTSGGGMASVGGMTSGGDGVTCVDKQTNCADYARGGTCTDPKYTGWVKDNCAKTCLCSGGSYYTGQMVGTGTGPGAMTGTGGTGTMTGGTGTMTGTGGTGTQYTGPCVDTKSDCAAYGQTVCTDPMYAGWVKDNCAKTCNKCSYLYTSGPGTSQTGHQGYIPIYTNGQLTAGGQYVSTGTQYPGTGTGTGTMTGTGSGTGTITGTGTGTGSGTGTMIGTGGPGTMTGGSGSGTGTITGGTGSGTGTIIGTGTGNGTITGGTGSGTGTITGGGGSGTGTITGGGGSGTGTITGGFGTGTMTGTCVDKLDNCASYGLKVCTDPQYAGWAKDNCCLFCATGGGTGHGIMTGTGHGTMTGTGHGTMTGTGTGHGTMTGTGTGHGTITGHGGTGTMISGSCVDKIATCSSYGTKVCSDTNYAGWVKDNCCSYCATVTMTGGTGTMSGTGTGTGHGTGGGFAGHSTGCVYNGQVYQQGQTWKDGCKAKCTCTNASTGQYNCEELCVQWQLPQSCTMNPPAAGMCCPTPNCPSNVNIQYPPNYVPQ